jgi:hypothetical protein
MDHNIPLISFSYFHENIPKLEEEHNDVVFSYAKYILSDYLDQHRVLPLVRYKKKRDKEREPVFYFVNQKKGISFGHDKWNCFLYIVIDGS